MRHGFTRRELPRGSARSQATSPPIRSTNDRNGHFGGDTEWAGATRHAEEEPRCHLDRNRNVRKQTPCPPLPGAHFRARRARGILRRRTNSSGKSLGGTDAI